MKKRIKSVAVVAKVPDNTDSCALDINSIGILSREITVMEALMNDEIALITNNYAEKFTPLKEKLKALQQGVQIFCEANRNELTQDGRVKSAVFVTGTVIWRQRPPSVAVSGVSAVIELLKTLKLERFVRTKEEINKEAILNEQDAVANVAGLSIKKGIEDFVIEPFEIDV